MAQFFGGLIGLLLVAKVLKRAIADPSVNYIVTVPGSSGVELLIAEVIISFGLMTIVLCTSNNQRLAQWTGVFGHSGCNLYRLKLRFQA